MKRNRSLTDGFKAREWRNRLAEAGKDPSPKARLLQRALQGCPESYEPMLSLIFNAFGPEKLRNAEVLEFGPREKQFCAFLNKKFGTRAESTEHYAHNIGTHFAGRKFDLIIGNFVFERDAFIHRGYMPDSRLESPTVMFPTKGQLTTERAWVREERTELLRKLVEHLKPGGKIIMTGVSSKIIFHPDEISRAGLKILVHNAQIERFLATVLCKPG